jgi:gamma-glutamylcyclotransferase
MERTLLYFAYGSNLDVEQMVARCPGAVVVGTAVLPRHRLAFTGYSRGWDGAIATVVPANDSAVSGLLYQIPVRSMPPLDLYEGHPMLYCRVRRKVVDATSVPRFAYVYIMPLVGPELPPGTPYLLVLRRAYERFGFNVNALPDFQRGPTAKRSKILRIRQ